MRPQWTRQAAHGICRLALYAAVCFSLPACITLSSQNIDVSDLSPEPASEGRSLSQEVQALAEPLIDDGITPGMMVAVYTPGTGSQYFGFGTYDKASGAAPDKDTVFAIGSLTKLFIGALLSDQVQRGQLAWEDTLAELLPADIPLSEDAAAITLQQLATHTSGLPRQPMTVQTFSYFVRYLFTGRSFYDHYDKDYLFDFLEDFKKPMFSDYLYSNVGFAVLGYILERRTGQSLESLMAAYLLEPLDLHETVLSREAVPAGLKVASGYAGDQPGFIRRGEPVPDWRFTPIMRATGAMHSTASDLLSFATAHFRLNGSPLGTALEDTLRVRVELPDAAIALDWEQDEIQGQKIHYAVGFVAGYSSYMGIDVEQRLAVVVLQNSLNWDDRVGHRLLVRLRHNPAIQNTRVAGR